ncbi:hypothetical protein CTAYLR_001527 [Chrysophaeum taylorii]|uniref:PH domain-containing protein n=1 Tax=Chrysophaeum taylorii TaxID=2483200 RepID=A0AAD7XP10_9STRA|nr:hypothetical protein CTAYLR_001527 [Chrysophaeum taylorii]
MLSAEHISLQSRLVQQLIAIREKEMNYMLARYDAVGTQAALLAGFAVSSLTSLTPSEDDVSNTVEYLFYISSVVTIIACVHVILSTMAVSNWAPGLALRGPTGSMARAYDAARSERTPINCSFVVAVVAFAVQTTLAVYILDAHKKITSHALIATVLMSTYAVFSIFYTKRIHVRFFGDRDKATKGAETTMPLLDNPVTVIDDHPDIAARKDDDGDVREPLEPTRPSEFDMTGKLWKRADDSKRRTLFQDSWRERWFILHDLKLNYWKSGTDYAQNKKPCLGTPIDLCGMEVLVDMADSKWGFSLVPTAADDPRRAWHFRAPTEADRLAWSNKLVLATLVATNRDPLRPAVQGGTLMTPTTKNDEEDSF